MANWIWTWSLPKKLNFYGVIWIRSKISGWTCSWNFSYIFLNEFIDLSLCENNNESSTEQGCWTYCVFQSSIWRSSINIKFKFNLLSYELGTFCDIKCEIVSLQQYLVMNASEACTGWHISLDQTSHWLENKCCVLA